MRLIALRDNSVSLRLVAPLRESSPLPDHQQRNSDETTTKQRRNGDETATKQRRNSDETATKQRRSMVHSRMDHDFNDFGLELRDPCCLLPSSFVHRAARRADSSTEAATL